MRGLCPMNCGLRVELNEIPPALQADLSRVDEIWTEGTHRFGGPYLCGAKFTAADAFFAPVAYRVQTYGLPLSGPAQAYADLVLGHPSMQDWYASALVEPWREENHEAEAQSVGNIVDDHRKRIASAD